MKFTVINGQVLSGQEYISISYLVTGSDLDLIQNGRAQALHT